MPDLSRLKVQYGRISLIIRTGRHDRFSFILIGKNDRHVMCGRITP